MFTTIIESLRNWNAGNNDRAKLQHAYFTAIITFVVLAGLTSLLNVELGRQILALAAVVGGVFLINSVAWALLQTFIIIRLNTPSRQQSKPAAAIRSTTKK